MTLFALLITGCDNDTEGPAADFSGNYNVTFTEAGVSETHLWSLSQSGSQMVITDKTLALTTTGTVSGSTVTVPAQTVTVEGETFSLSMSFTFDASGQTFAGTQKTTLDGVTVTKSFSGTKL